MSGYDYLLADTIGFTAARKMDEHARNVVVAPALDVRIPYVSRYVTGGARGGDAFIGYYLYATRRDAEHVVIVPANRSQIDPWWETVIARGGAVTVIEMPEGTSYADRNERIVHESDALAGFPAYPEDDHRSIRSGTWQTIRMAKRADVLSQWHCVNPPYAGRIDKYIETRRQAS
jgi:hypothetical protein